MTKELFFIIDNNIYSLLVLFVISYTVLKNVNKKSNINMYIKGFTIVLFIQILFETLTYLLETTSKPIIFKNNMIYINTVLLSLNATFIPYFMTMFFINYIGFTKNIKAKKIVAITPVFLTGILLMINMFVPILFTAEGGKIIYKNFYILYLLLDFAPFLNPVIVIMWNRKKVVERDKDAVIIFFIFCFVALCIRSFLNVKFTIYTLMAIALSIELILLKNKLSQYDSVTKLESRETADEFIEEAIDNEKNISVIYIDCPNIIENYLNDAKDVIIQAEKEIASIIINNSIEESKKIRYSINKFMIIYINTRKEIIDRDLEKIKVNLKENNIKTSIIVNSFDKEKDKTKGQFLRRLEVLMSKKENIKTGGIY